jgi:hypothetical protein
MKGTKGDEKHLQYKLTKEKCPVVTKTDYIKLAASFLNGC